MSPEMSGDLAIEAFGIGKLYRIGSTPRSTSLRDTLSSGPDAILRWALRRANGEATAQELWALRDISFTVKSGESVGLIGSNGSGKSTLLKIVSRIVTPTIGHARIRGRVGALLEVGSGFHPELSGRDNIFLNGAIIGMSAADIRRRYDEIVAFSGVEEFLGLPIKRYSSGMVMRLAFSVAAHLEPDVLIIDEVLAVGDAEFQRKCLARMDDVAKSGCTVFFVSHNLPAVQRLCTRAILLNGGQMVLDGNPDQAISTYLDIAAPPTLPDQWIELPPPLDQRKGATFKAVRYSDPNRPAGAGPRSLGPLRIEVLVESDFKRMASLAADIRDELGNKLINADCRTKNHMQIELPAGESIWRLEFSSLYLEGGKYMLDLWLADSLGSELDWRGMAAQLNVLTREGLPFDPARRAQVEGIVACPFEVTRGEKVDGSSPVA